MAARGGGGAIGRDRGIGGLKDLSSLVQENSLVLERLSLTAPTGPQPDPLSLQNPAFETTQVQPEFGPTHMWGTLCVGLVRSVPDPVYGPEDCFLYIFDLDEDDSNEWSVKAPTIRFNMERFDFEAFCVLGDTLYIFEYYHPYAEYEGGRKVWTFQLPLSQVLVNWRLEEQDLVEVSPMNCPKFCPRATSTPDGKILVFATRSLGSKNKDTVGDFELYDPQKQLWEQLPGLSIDLYIRKFEIYASAFLRNEPVLVLSTSFGMFTLDIRPSKDNKEWKRFVPSSGQLRVQPHDRAPEFVLFRDDFCLNSSVAFELVGENNGIFKYPQVQSLGLDFTRRVSSVALLSITNDGNGCFFCAMDTQIEKDTWIPHIVINVYHFDYTKFKKHLKKGKIGIHLLPGTKVLKSFKFRISPQESDELDLFCFGSIPGNN